MSYNKEEVMKAFDEQFGKAGPKKNSDSIGREAGCDDCSTSIKVREETRDFISTALDQAVSETAKAYGGCTNCYGKGYSTTKVQAGNHRVGIWEIDPIVPCPKCERGVEIQKIKDQTYQAGKEARSKEINEKISWFTRYMRSKYSQDCSRGETEEEKRTEMLEAKLVFEALK